MQRNETFEGVCEGLGTNGEGIVRQDGKTVFVPFLLPGERARIKILKEKENIAYGKAEEIFTPAEERVRPECPVFHRCGGCQLQHMRYRTQLRFKSALVEDALRKIAGISFKVPLTVKSEKSYAYRNKLQLPIGREKGENVVGFFAERSHRIVPTDVCPLHGKWVGALIEAVKKFMSTCGLDGYDEANPTGLRHIVVRELRRRYIVTLVAAEREIPGIDYLLFLLDGVFKEYSFYLNYNPNNTNVIFGEEFRLLKGPGFYETVENDISCEVGPNTFVQVNDNVRGKLYEQAVSLVGTESVLDCYSGGGLLTAMFAKKCGRAFGIEVVPEASECAARLSERNGLQGAMFNLCGRVEDILPGLLEREPGATVVLDPPRAGVDRAVLRELIRKKVPKIIMISCNPATLARDLGILTGSLRETENGELLKQSPDGVYDLQLVRPFDMFPQTKHVETLVLLTLGSQNSLSLPKEFS